MYFGDTNHRREKPMPASGRVYLSSCLLLFPPTALSLPKSSSRRTLYSTKSALFLIVFLESKVVKSRFSTPIYGRPTRAPRPNVHIWPPLILQKASKSAFFNGEVEVAQGGFEMPSLRMSARQLADRASRKSRTVGKAVLAHIGEQIADATRRYHSNLIRIRNCAHRQTTRRCCVRAYKRSIQ